MHMWKKRGVQKISTHMAHRKGMRVSRVCAWQTSALAYDGSGKVERDKENHSICTFTNGKRYNCDLSASYNIGARYYIRELTKPMRRRGPCWMQKSLQYGAEVHVFMRILSGSMQ